MLIQILIIARILSVRNHAPDTSLNIQHAPGVSCMDYCHGTHFHLFGLLGTLSCYTILGVSAVWRPMRVCCGSQWGWCVLFIS